MVPFKSPKSTSPSLPLRDHCWSTGPWAAFLPTLSPQNFEHPAFYLAFWPLFKNIVTVTDNSSAKWQ